MTLLLILLGVAFLIMALYLTLPQTGKVILIVLALLCWFIAVAGWVHPVILR